MFVTAKKINNSAQMALNEDYWSASQISRLIGFLLLKISWSIEFLRSSFFVIFNVIILFCAIVLSRNINKTFAILFMLIVSIHPILFYDAHYLTAYMSVNLWFTTLSSVFFFLFLVKSDHKMLYWVALFSALDLSSFYHSSLILYFSFFLMYILKFAITKDSSIFNVRSILIFLGIFISSFFISNIIFSYFITGLPFHSIKSIPSVFDMYFGYRIDQSPRDFSFNSIWENAKWLLKPGVRPSLNEELDFPQSLYKLPFLNPITFYFGIMLVMYTYIRNGISKKAHQNSSLYLLLPIFTAIVVYAKVAFAQRYFLPFVIPVVLFSTHSISEFWHKYSNNKNIRNALLISLMLIVTVSIFEVYKVKINKNQIGRIPLSILHGRQTGFSRLLSYLQREIRNNKDRKVNILIDTKFQTKRELLMDNFIKAALPPNNIEYKYFNNFDELISIKKSIHNEVFFILTSDIRSNIILNATQFTNIRSVAFDNKAVLREFAENPR